MNLNRPWTIARGAAKDFLDDDVLSLAAAVAFYTALSFAPLVLLLVSIGGLLSDRTGNQLLGVFSKQLGPRAADVAQGVLEATQRQAASQPAQWWHSVLSTVGLLVTSSAVFGQLQVSLNRIWDVKIEPDRPLESRGRWRTLTLSTWAWLRKRLISMGMVLTVLFILLVSLIISTVASSLLPGGEAEKLAARIADFVVSFLVAALLFAAIFKVLPDVPIRWREVWLGSLVTSGLFNVGKLLLALYIDRGGVGRDYGEAVGGLIALLVWVYYSCVALLLGAEITQRIGTRHGSPP